MDGQNKEICSCKSLKTKPNNKCISKRFLKFRDVMVPKVYIIDPPLSTRALNTSSLFFFVAFSLETNIINYQ